MKAVAGGYVSEIVVGDKVTWMFGGDTYVFFVNKIDGEGEKRWVIGSQAQGGENTMFVPMREVSLVERTQR